MTSKRVYYKWVCKDFGTPKLKSGFTVETIRIGMRRRLMCFVYRSHVLSSYCAVLFTTELLHFCDYSCFFFILLAAQLKPGQMQFLIDPPCNTHAYLFVKTK